MLVAGGDYADNTAELYDPATETWTRTGNLNIARYGHTATLLPNGKVLVAGGFASGIGALASAELYDPASGTWALTGSLADARALHTATLLPNGKVLIAAGDLLASAELYDPATGTWTRTDGLAAARYDHTATLLPNGKVLVAGGEGHSGFLASAELYDPASATWTATGNLINERWQHTATLLPDGNVLVAGGGESIPIASAELYDPASGTWSNTKSLATARRLHTATLLPNGKVLIAGGSGEDKPALRSAELYDTGLGYKSAWQPKITDLKFTGGKRLLLEGSLFQGISQASGNNTQDSSTNYPIVQLRHLDSEQVTFLFVDPLRGWSDTSFYSLPARGFVSGPALATVFTNGIPSTAKYLLVPQGR